MVRTIEINLFNMLRLMASKGNSNGAVDDDVALSISVGLVKNSLNSLIPALGFDDADSMYHISKFMQAEDPILYDKLLSECKVTRASVGSSDGKTVLHSITDLGWLNRGVNTEILLRYILTYDTSPDINAQTNDYGYTPLWRAVFNNNIDAVKVFIDFGACRDIRVFSNAGVPSSNPLDLALRKNFRDIVAILTEYTPTEE